MSQQVESNQLKKGSKIEINGHPYNAVVVDLVKPGKGQAFTRIKLKNLRTGQMLERTLKSNEKVTLADVEETTMRMIYREADGAVFMNDTTFEQVTISMNTIGEDEVWLMEELLYNIVFFKGEAVDFTPPNFIEMMIKQTDPGERGNSSGKVLKPAVTETGAKIQIPLFINEGEKVKIDTRTYEYISRV